MNHMLKIRKHQFVAFIGLGFFYTFIYRRFLHPKSIMNSVLYHNAMKFANQSAVVGKELGKFEMMNCNGKTWPLLSTCNFDMVMFGSKAKGKIRVNAEYSKQINQWKIMKMDLITKENR